MNRKSPIKKTGNKRQVRAKGKGQSPTAKIPPILQCLSRPFDAPAAHWPDPDCAPAGLATSHLHTLFTPVAGSGTSTLHNTFWFVNPYPSASLVTVAENAAGNQLLGELNAAGTAYIVPPVTVPNLLALCGTAGGMKIRCTGMGVRLEYAGTELNRSATIVSGLIAVDSDAGGVPGTGTVLDEMSALGFNNTSSVPSIKDFITDYQEHRVPSSGFIEFVWKPSCIPSYQTFNTLNGPTTATVAGAAVNESIYSAPYGGDGVQKSQNILVIGIIGDTTPAAAATGNVYNASLIWHWEVTPTNVSGVTYDLETSFADSHQLDVALNAMAKLQVARVVQGNGMSRR